MVNYFKDTIFSRSCYYGDSEINVIKTESGKISFYCVEEDVCTITVLDEDNALELANAIIEVYKK